MAVRAPSVSVWQSTCLCVCLSVCVCGVHVSCASLASLSSASFPFSSACLPVCLFSLLVLFLPLCLFSPSLVCSPFSVLFLPAVSVSHR